MYPDGDPFKFAKAASIKYTILHCSKQGRFGSCKTICMFLFACSKSPTFIDVLVSHVPKLMSCLV